MPRSLLETISVLLLATISGIVAKDSTLLQLNKTEGRILNGNSVIYAGGYPSYHAEILYKSASRWAVRGGTIISRWHILTSAGYVKNWYNGVRITAYIGSLALRQGYKIEVDKVFPHEDFVRGSLQNDIAVMETTLRILFSDFVSYAVIPAFYDGDTGITVSAQVSPDMVYAPIQILANDDCNNVEGFLGEMHICAKTLADGIRLESTEIGGALTLGDSIVKYPTIVGILTAVPESINVDLVVYTRLSYYVNWIINNQKFNINKI